MLGQRKLLDRLVPGLMHAFIFWGFLILFPTIVMAMISAVDQDETLPWLGRQGWFMALVDVFVILVLLGVLTAFVIRKLVRPARFEGSHRGEADLILMLIAGVVLTLLGWHAARIAAGLNEWPAHWSFLSNALSHAVQDGRIVGARLRLGAPRVRPRLPRLPAVLEAPAHRRRRGQRLVRPDASARTTRAAALRRTGRARCASEPAPSPT